MAIWPFSSRVPNVAVLRLSGVISPSGRPFSGSLNMAGLAVPIQQAFSLRGVKAVALSINSPGGSPVQSALIARRVRSLAREKELPVFAFIEDIAASGGYWLACAADEIFAEPSSIVGSIGVISAGFGFQEAIKRLGIERRVYAEGRHKAILDPFKPEDPDDIERLKVLQRDIFQDFKDHVRERRGKRLKGDQETLFNGDVWTGGRAAELGLIDGLGDLRTILRDRFGERVKLRPVGSSRRWFRRRIGLTLGISENLSSPEELVNGFFDAMEARALWARYGI
ncbi:MAG: putative signal peptide peptidase SppA [Alphaproteobacteria bacterium MarineAlpha9_Bin6]|nr:MAG: putative signal peptide peptidase SppA [Alphaproteobacteria bacterium MarineAlpha9_Bin6]